MVQIKQITSMCRITYVTVRNKIKIKKVDLENLTFKYDVIHDGLKVIFHQTSNGHAISAILAHWTRRNSAKNFEIAFFRRYWACDIKPLLVHEKKSQEEFTKWHLRSFRNTCVIPPIAIDPSIKGWKVRFQSFFISPRQLLADF